MNNIQNLANELDKQSEKYKKIRETLSTPDYNSYSKIIKEYVKLKEQNKLLEEISQLDIKRKNMLLLKIGNRSKDSNDSDSDSDNNRIIIHHDINKASKDNKNKENNMMMSNKNEIVMNKNDDTFSFAFGLLSCVWWGLNITALFVASIYKTINYI